MNVAIGLFREYKHLSVAIFQEDGRVTSQSGGGYSMARGRGDVLSFLVGDMIFNSVQETVLSYERRQRCRGY